MRGGPGRQNKGPGIRPGINKRPRQEQNQRAVANNKRQQTGGGRRAAGEEDEDFRRAMRRMEMGPDDDMGPDSELDSDSLEEDNVQLQLPTKRQPQHQGSKQPGLAGQKDTQGNGYLLGPASSEGEDDGGLEDDSQSASSSDEDALDMDDEGGNAGVSGESSSEDDDEAEDDELPVEKSARQSALAFRGSLKRAQATGVSDDSDEGSDEDEDGGMAGAGMSEEDSEEAQDDDEDDEDDSTAGSDEEGALQQLAELPLEARLALLRDGTGPQGEVAKAAAKQAKIQEQSFKRVNKHRPQEMSSKRPVSRFKQVVEPVRKSGKDPRFAPMRGDSEREAAARRYAFLYDDVMAQEKADLSARVKKEKHPGRRAALSSELQRVQQALSRETQRRARSDLENKIKGQQRQAVESGKKPFFLKESDKKKLALVAKYESLKSKGQLARFMEKRRKHNASKDHRYIPTGRRDAGQE